MKRPNSFAISVAVLLTVVITGCRVANQAAPEPKAVTKAVAPPDHKGFERNCAVCHEPKRPAAPHVQQIDCVSCHAAGTFWLDLKTYNHQPLPASCVRCHETDRPAPLFLVSTLHGKGADCVGCHEAGTAWKNNKPFSHEPSPATCAACHETQRPSQARLPTPNVTALAGHFGSQECAECHRPQPEGGSFIFEHRDAKNEVVASCLPCHEARRKTAEHYRGEDCVGCHINPAKPWKLSVASPHPANEPMPQLCGSCHVGWRPLSTKLPAPAGEVAGHFGVQDCIDCHKPANATVTAFEFSHAATGLKIATCLPCHEAKRPTTVINSFLHAAGGMGDCASCHSKPGVAWNDGYFSHNPAPQACATCHRGDRPASAVNGFVHLDSAGDCARCHQRPGFTWADGRYDHASRLVPTCATCHESKRPVALVNRFLHSERAGVDCAGCHLKPGETWSGGEFAHSGTPLNCAVCHAADRPTAAVAPGAFKHPAAESANCAVCHTQAGVQWTEAKYPHLAGLTACATCHEAKRPTAVVGSFLHSISGTGDCVSCHKQPGVSWSGGIYSHSPAPTTCASCHGNDRPAGVVKNFDHAIAGTGDCLRCHQKPGETWADGTYSHSPAPASCAVCHSSKRPTAVVNSFAHSIAGNGDCVSCHRQPGVTWAGGLYSHQPLPSSCQTCHSAERPAVPVNGFSHGINGTGDCVYCHKSPGVTWTGGKYSHSPVPSECSSCHLSKRPTTVVNRFLHSVAGTGDCAPCHQQPGVTWSGGKYAHSPAPLSCAGCHAAQRPAATVSNFNHTGNCGDCHWDYHDTYDCARCHTRPGVTWVTSNMLVQNGYDCASCHEGGGGPPLGPQPPGSPASFNDGISTESSTRTPSMSWSASLPGTAPVARYELAIGTTRLGIDVRGWTSVGLVTSATLDVPAMTSCKDYYVSVRAFDTEGRVSAVAAGDGFRYYGPGCPTAPTGLTATFSGTGIALSWTRESTANATSYKIQRSRSSVNNFVDLATVGAEQTSYVDTDVQGWTYYYRVQAIGPAGPSFWSNTPGALARVPVVMGTFNGKTYMTTPGNCANSTCSNADLGQSDTVSRTWGPATASGAQNTSDGLANKAILNSATYPAANFCNTLNFGGYSDWFLPSATELALFNTYAAQIPGRRSSSSYYWSSTENPASPQTSAWGRNGYGTQTSLLKSSSYYVRCVRHD